MPLRELASDEPSLAFSQEDDQASRVLHFNRPHRPLIFINRFFHPDQSPTSLLLSDLVSTLAAEGHTIHVIASRLHYDDHNTPLAKRETVAGAEVHRVWSTRFGRARLWGRLLDFLTFYPTAGWRLWRLARRGDVVVVKTDPPLFGLLASPIVRLRGAIQINWIQDLFPEIGQALGVRALNGRPGRLLIRMRNRALRQASCNIVLGEDMAESLCGHDIARERIRIIANWSNSRALHPVPHEANPLRAEWGLNGKFVVSYAGNLGRAHEFSTLLEAAEQLRDDHRIVFLIVGFGYYRGWLEEQARRRGLDNIRFQPYQPLDRLALSLSAADAHLVTLHPSIRGMLVPSKIYNIAAVARPILFVGRGDSEAGRFVRRHDCGEVIDNGQAARLAATVRRLSQDPQRGAAWGRNARAALVEHYDRQHALDQWRRILESLQPVASR